LVRFLSVAAIAALPLLSCAGQPVHPDDPIQAETPAGSDPGAPAATEAEAAAPAPPAPSMAAPADDQPSPAPDVEPPPANVPAGNGAARPGSTRYAGPAGTIPRKELLSFLDTRPAVFLRRVESEPRIEGGRFRGWRIVSFFPDDPRFRDIDLVSGDVVTRVNGLSIEQPDQFIKAWEQLRAARELRVDMLRNGRPHIARWTIID
jgi:hypothetical protein